MIFQVSVDIKRFENIYHHVTTAFVLQICNKVIIGPRYVLRVVCT